MGIHKSSTNSVTSRRVVRLALRTATSPRHHTTVIREQGQERSAVVQELIENHLARVYRFALYLVHDHHAAQDIAQEAMLRAWRQRRQLRNSSSKTAWLLRITANLCRDHQRRGRHWVSQAGPIETEPAENAAEPWEHLAQLEQLASIKQVIESLSERERTVLYLSAFEQLTNTEVAESLQISKDAVKVALSRARKAVRHELQRQE